ncbi:MAG: hypothetical protein AB1726_17985 [Planctomycetota bacterium]
MSHRVTARAFLSLIVLLAACAAPSRSGAPGEPTGRAARGSPPSAGRAAPPRSASTGWEIGGAGGVTLGDGEPANDLTTYGVFARRRLNDVWAARFALDRMSYDFERPAKLLGITQDPGAEVVDAAATATTLSAWIERTFGGAESANEWFAGAGLGLSSVDVDDASGPVAGGGSFDIATDAGTEILASLDAGYRRALSAHWTLEGLLRVNQHFADWKVVDRVSGAEGTVDDYTTWSFLLGIAYGL